MTTHVCTVHWQSDRWIDLQLAGIARHFDEPLVYAFLNNIGADRRSDFFYSSTESIVDHATKLNLLGDIAAMNGDPNDLLVFIDGDAFPVGRLDSIRSKLPTRHLAAVKPLESNGDRQPHPSFCVTTIGFWQELEGDWHEGATWVDDSGGVATDVGGNLLAQLERTGIDWLPMLRLNRVNPHPMLFGVYGLPEEPLVYHHGSGFRYAYTKIDLINSGRSDAQARMSARLLDWLPAGGFLGKVRYRLHPVDRLEREIVERAEKLSKQQFVVLRDDAEAWRSLV